MFPKYTKISFIGIVAMLLMMSLWFRPIWTLPEGVGKFTYDAKGYYSYLPGIFIHHDLKTLNHGYEIERQYGIPAEQGSRLPNGNVVLQYSCGQAVIELPWFGLGHLVAKMGKYRTDGYSKPYNVVMDFGMLLWCVLGIFILGKVLLRYYDDLSTAITLFLLTVGTNYLPYATILNTYTHSPLFTIYALLLYAIIKFYENPNYLRAAAIGGLVGLATLTRPTEIICILLPLLWGVSDKKSLLERLDFIKTDYKKLLLAIIITGMIGSLQLLYWKYITGHFIYYSYGDQGFHFLSPYLYKCLFSSQKGWVTYSPIVIISLIGFYFFWKKTNEFANLELKNHRLVLTIVAILALWITFSWDIWWYGGGLGQRAMIQYLPIYAFPFAAFVHYISSKKIGFWLFGLFVLISLYHNAWVIYGAWDGGYIDTVETNDAYLFRTLWRWTKPTNQDRYLMDNKDNDTKIDNPKVIYSNDFEADTSKSSLTVEAISGKKSIQISPQFVTTTPINIPINSNMKAIRLKALIKIGHREWDLWATPQIYMQFKKGNESLNSAHLKIHRGLVDWQTIHLYMACKVPKESDNVSIIFSNDKSQTSTTIDDITVECNQ